MSEVHPHTPQPEDDAYRQLALLTEVEGLTRRTLIKRAGAASATLAIPALIAACGGSASSGKTASNSTTTSSRAGRKGGALSAALASDYQTFDPANATTVTSIAINVHVFEPLIQISLANRQLSPALATGMPQKINATTYRVAIRQGVKFHDGSPLTSKDVVYSFKRVLDAKTQSFFQQFITFIKDIKAVNDHTVEFLLQYPTDLLPERLPVVKIVPEAIVAKQGATKFGLKPIGTGPYSFVSAMNNNSVVLKRFTPYNGPTPGSINTLTFQIQTNASTRIASLRSGQVAAVEAPLDTDLQPTAAVPGLSTAALPGFEMQFLMCNCKVAKFQDVRVRQALHWAIDLNKITQDVFIGNATAATSYLPENHPDYVRPSTVYTYNPDKAKQLLQAAGYSSSKPLTFELLVYSDTPWIADTYTIVQQNWADVGIKVQEVGGGENLYNRVIGKGDYDAFLALADQSLFGWDAGLLLGWHFGAEWTDHLYFWNTAQKKQIASLLTKSQHQTNAAAQKQTFATIQNIVAQQVPLYPLHHRKSTSAWSNKTLAKFTPIETSGLDLRSAELAA